MKVSNTTNAAGLVGLHDSQKRLNQILEKMAKGKRITRASDDAAGLAIARELEKQVRGFKQANSSLSDAMGALRIADSGANSISDMLQRQRELALQASNGTLNGDQRSALNQEFQALSAEIDRTAKISQFNGQGLLDGSSPLSDGSGSVNAGSGGAQGDTISMSASDLRSSTLGLSNLDISQAGAASQAINNLDTAMRQVSLVRTGQGAVTNRMEHAQSNSKNQEIQSAYAQSQLEDLDYASAKAEQMSASLLSRSSLSVMENFNQIARNNMSALLQ